MSRAAPGARNGRRGSGPGFAGWRWRVVSVQPEVHPIRPPELDRVLRPVGAVPAAHGIGRTELLAAPADALGMAGMERDFGCHGQIVRADPPANLDEDQPLQPLGPPRPGAAIPPQELASASSRSIIPRARCA